MSDLAALRAEALGLYQAAIAAADPMRAVRAHAKHFPQPDPGGQIIVLAVGKAARAMAASALEQISGKVTALVVTNSENAIPLPGARVLASGHPVPDAAGAKAALEVEALLDQATPNDRVLALISGGGSALLPAPVSGVTLEDKADVARLLLASGWDIVAMNALRQHLSRLKGGGLLRRSPAPVTALILSDVVGDDLRVIASGPTVAPIAARAQVVADLMKGGLWDKLPLSVQTHLQTPEDGTPLPTAQNILIGSNSQSLLAMATPGSTLIRPALTGDVAEACARIVALAKDSRRPARLILGGETTVQIKGRGLGGRNQELALRLAMAGLPGAWVFLSGGTDGRDGPTDAAGGIVDPGTLARIRAKGGDPAKMLANNDSYNALEMAGDLLKPGPTGTNVADVQVLLLT